MSKVGWFVAFVGFLLSGCTPTSEHVEVSTSRVDVQLPPAASAKTEPSGTASAALTVEAVAADEPLRAGLLRFEGMVRPTKGGFDIRGVTLDPYKLYDALERGGTPRKGEDAVLGAKVRVTAELVREEDAAPVGSLAVQRREGTYFRAKHIETAEVVARPVEVEGKLERSKGFFSISSHLVSEDDSRWSLVVLNGNFEGKRVRLWGQPRTVVCKPNAQCLITGSLPLFDIGRAEVVPP